MADNLSTAAANEECGVNSVVAAEPSNNSELSALDIKEDCKKNVNFDDSSPTIAKNNVDHDDSKDCDVSSTVEKLALNTKNDVAPSPETEMETDSADVSKAADSQADMNSSLPTDDSVCSTSTLSVDPHQDKQSSSVSPAVPSKLKKDDSGISVRESLTSDESKCEDEEGARTGSGGRETRPSVSTESEGLVADMLDTEDSENNVEEQPESPMYSETSDSSGDELRLAGRRRQRRHTRSSSSSSSSSSSTTSGPDEHVSGTESDQSDSQEDMEVDMASMPRDPWSAMFELRRRETGQCSRLPADRMFRQKTGSSLKLVQRLELQHQLEKHDGCVNALNFNKAGTLLASGSDDLSVVIWNWTEKKPYLAFESGHRSNVFQCKFMPYSGDTHLVTCARDGQVRLAELSSTGVCKGTKKLALHRSAAHKLALLQDSSHVFYSCGEDALVYEIDLRQDKPNKLSITKENDRRVSLYSIHSNPFKSYEYCVGGRDHYIRIYDKRMIADDSSHGVVKKFCPQHLVDHNEIKANVTCAVYNYNGTEVLGTYNDEDIYLFDTSHSDGAEYIHKYTGHRNNSTVKGVNFYGPRSEYVISGSDCSNVFLWEKESEKIVQYFHADDGGVVNVLEPHPHAPFLATSGLDSDVKIWAPTAKEPTALKGLKKLCRRNARERASERSSSEAEAIDGQMLWFLMQHLRRNARRRDRQEQDQEQPSSSSGNSDADSDADSDNPPESVQCVPS